MITRNFLVLFTILYIYIYIQSAHRFFFDNAVIQNLKI